MISILIPYHDTPETAFFLKRNIDSIMMQSFTDYEIVLTKAGKMAENTNTAIKRAKGEFIKILYLDDYFAHKDALKDMVEACTGTWIMCGTDNNPIPYWTDDIETGNNKLGSPSALLMRNEGMLFDENMSWLLDCDFYKRLHKVYGEPTILPGEHVNIGVGPHQVTNTMSIDEKTKEHLYLRNKYA